MSTSTIADVDVTDGEAKSFLDGKSAEPNSFSARMLVEGDG